MLITSKGVFGLPQLRSRRAFHGRRFCSRTFSSCVSCVSLRLFTPASVCPDVAGVDINLLDTVDVDVGNDIGGAGVMGVDVGGAGVVCVGVLLRIVVCFFVVLTDVGVFFLLTRFALAIRTAGSQSDFAKEVARVMCNITANINIGRQMQCAVGIKSLQPWSAGVGGIPYMSVWPKNYSD